MKIKVDKRYMKFCIYVAVTCMAVYLFTVVVNYAPDIFDSVGAFCGDIFEVLSPILVALVIAYLLFGPMKAVEKWLLKRKYLKEKKSLCRGISVATAYIAVLAILFGIFFGIYLMICGQISNSSTIANIITSIDEYFENNTLSADTLTHLIEKWNLPFGEYIADIAEDLAVLISDSFAGILGGVGDFVLAMGSNIFSFMVSLVLSIYILISYEYFLNLWDKAFFLLFRKSKVGKKVRHALHIVNYTFSKYIHGQLIEAFLVFVLSTIALSIVGVDYAFVIGIICGVCNLIPYIGPFVGIVFAAIMALFTGDLWSIVWSVVALMIVQQIDCNILCPNIVGDIVGLNAAFTLIAISIGGDVAGLFGMLIAVPVASCIKQLCSSWFTKKMDDEYQEYSANLHAELAKYKPIGEEKLKSKKKRKKKKDSEILNEEEYNELSEKELSEFYKSEDEREIDIDDRNKDIEAALFFEENVKTTDE